MHPGWQLICLDDAVWVLTAPTGLPIYDFAFDSCFPCRHPWAPPERVAVVARIGAFSDYAVEYAALLSEGLHLIHSPEEHHRASDLRGWYPLLSDVTPRSRWFDELPNADDIEDEFGWPVFVKGARQTSRHQQDLSIIRSAIDFKRALVNYRQDAILGWQTLVVREFVPLRPVEDAHAGRIPSSFEFRTFWWKGQHVGSGRYWWEGRRYDWTDEERRDALALAADAAKRVGVAFLVIDVAMTADGRWIVIECNDGQESGYAGASPIGIWQRIIDVERSAPEPS